MPRLPSARHLALAAIFLLVSTACRAASAQPVVELYNTVLGHYFMTLNAAEIAAIEAGAAGPGWVRTGYEFLACDLADVGPCIGPSMTVVRRFYGTPGLGPNSHFYTGDPAEAAILERPGTGWTFEEEAFTIATPSSARAA